MYLQGTSLQKDCNSYQSDVNKMLTIISSAKAASTIVRAWSWCIPSETKMSMLFLNKVFRWDITLDLLDNLRWLTGFEKYDSLIKANVLQGGNFFPRHFWRCCTFQCLLKCILIYFLLCPFKQALILIHLDVTGISCMNFSIPLIENFLQLDS